MIGTEIQKAIFDVLTAAPAVAGGSIFDAVPDSDRFPRVTIGEEQTFNDDNACGDGWEVFADVHVWSREIGFPQAKEIAATVVDRVEGISAVAGHRLVSVEFQDQRALRDPDGHTRHIVCSFRFLVDESSA